MSDDASAATAVIVAASAAAVAALVVVHTLRRRSAWLAGLGTVLLLLAIAVTPWAPADGRWDGALNIVGYALVFAVYPGGRLISRWLVVPVVGYAGLGILYALSGTHLLGEPWSSVLALSVVLLLPVLVHRYRRRQSTRERERVRWGVLGVVLTFGGMTTLAIVAAVGGTTISASGPTVRVLALLAGAALPVCLAIGLLRPRLVPVDVILAQVIRFGLCTLVIGSACALLLRALPSDSGTWLCIALAAIAGVALLPLATRAAERFVYAGRMSPRAALRALEERLVASGDPNDASEAVAETVARALRASAVGVEVAGVQRASAGVGGAAPAGGMACGASVFPVMYTGEQVATIRILPRAGETGLTAADRRIAIALAARSAPALQAAQAVSALVQARADIVLAREEERRSLRRDLHDDLAPTLVGLGLTASGLARMLRAHDPDLAEVSVALAGDVQSAIAQTRALAYGLRPPGLDDTGLAAAVRDRARSTGELRIEVDAPAERLELPAAVEVAALRLVQEAVTNVRRHAGARHCAILIELAEGALHVTVDDDGRGMADGAPAGIGIASMTERAAELGGSVRLLPSARGGLRVEAALPVGAG